MRPRIERERGSRTEFVPMTADRDTDLAAAVKRKLPQRLQPLSGAFLPLAQGIESALRVDFTSSPSRRRAAGICAKERVPPNRFFSPGCLERPFLARTPVAPTTAFWGIPSVAGATGTRSKGREYASWERRLAGTFATHPRGHPIRQSSTCSDKVRASSTSIPR